MGRGIYVSAVQMSGSRDGTERFVVYSGYFTHDGDYKTDRKTAPVHEQAGSRFFVRP